MSLKEVVDTQGPVRAFGGRQVDIGADWQERIGLDTKFEVKCRMVDLTH